MCQPYYKQIHAHSIIIILTPKASEGVGVKLLIFIVARKPGKCPSLAPTKNNL